MWSKIIEYIKGFRIQPMFKTPGGMKGVFGIKFTNKKNIKKGKSDGPY